MSTESRAEFWQKRHHTQQERCAFWLRTALAVFWAAVGVAILTFASLPAGNQSAAQGVVGIDNIADTINGALASSSYELNVWGIYALTALVTGIPAFLANAERAKRWAAELFPSYCPDSFEPIPSRRADIGADRVLPWATDSHMDRIFADLRKQFCNPEETGTDKVSFWRPLAKRTVPKPFDHVLILGRPGAGKSRLAEHLARQLSRRDVLGDSRNGTPTNSKAAKRLESSETRRRFLWWRERKGDDPWDSGLIQRGKRPQQTLQLWRPARPTILWMDDPMAGDARDWIDRLREFAPLWRYPVRLIIANQTRLQDVPNPENPDSVKLLYGKTYFTPDQVFALSKADNLNPFDRTRAKALHDLTTGNPLLVELAFEALRRGKPLADLTQNDLISGRVDRVLSSLKQADASLGNAEPLAALALGTLAGPNCKLEDAARLLGKHGLTASILQKAFPAEQAQGIDLSTYLPMIKPEQIGDALIRRLADEASWIPERVRDALFALDPAKWLLVAARLGRGPDKTADAFCKAPAGFAEAGDALREDAFKTWIWLGHFGWREPLSMAELVDEVISAIPDEAARSALGARLFDWHLEQVEADWQARSKSNQRWHAALAEGKTTDEAAAEQERDAEQPLRHRFMSGDAIAAFGLMLAAHRFGCATDELTLDHIKERMDCADALAGVSRVTDNSRAMKVCTTWVQQMFGIGRAKINWPNAGILTQLRRERAWPGLPGLALREHVRGALHDLLDDFATMPDLVRVWSMRLLASSANCSPESCREVLARAEEIAAKPRHAKDRKMQLERALALSSLAFVEKDDAARCRAAQEQVEAIAAQPQYADDRNMQWVRVNTLRHRVFSESRDSASCRAAQEQVEAIAAQPQYADDRNMQWARANAWRNVSVAEREVSARCRAAQKQVEVIAAQPQYAEDREMQLDRAWALNSLVWAEMADPARCREAQKQVEAIAAQPPYALDRELQFIRVSTLRFLAYSERANGPSWARAVERLAEICAAWRDDAPIGEQLTIARSYRSER